MAGSVMLAMLESNELGKWEFFTHSSVASMAGRPCHRWGSFGLFQGKIAAMKCSSAPLIRSIRCDTYFAMPMSESEFDDYFERSQHWLTTHGKIREEGVVDITRTYVRQQLLSKFRVMDQ
jgi:hypothetical protein